MAKHRKPADILALKGAFRKDRANKIIKPKPPKRPGMPPTLSEGARKEWKRLAPKTYALGTLHDPDVRSFELLCEVLATERQARAVVEKDGLTLVTDTAIKSNPAVKVMETARAQSTRLLEAFGLTPKSRTGVDLRPPDKTNKDNPFDEF